MEPSNLESLGDRIAEHAAHLDAATHRLLTDLRQFDLEGGWNTQGFRSCAQWLSYRVGWDGNTAREHVRVASKLGQLPLIDDALRRGEMSYSKVRAMTRVATPENEQMLLEEARYSTGAQLDKICRQYAAVTKHDLDPSPRDDVHRRYINRHVMSDGMVKIDAVLHPEEAAILWAALDRVGVELCREQAAEQNKTGAGSDPRATPAFNATQVELSTAISSRDEPVDIPHLMGVSAETSEKNNLEALAAKKLRPFDRVSALVAIAQTVLRGRSQNRAPVDLMVSVSIDALRAPAPASSAIASVPDHTPGMTEQRPAVVPAPEMDPFGRWSLEGMFDPLLVAVFGDATVVSQAAARRIACDAGIVSIIEDERGSPLSVGRKQRTIPDAMKRALLRRDCTCRFPGCSVRVFLEGHHIEHWADGGATDHTNIIMLCGFHHRFLHEYGYRIEGLASGEVQFVDPRGKAFAAVPKRLRPDDLGWPAILASNEALGISGATPACGFDGGRVDYHLCIDALVKADQGLVDFSSERDLSS